MTTTELAPVRRVDNGELDRGMSMPALTLAHAVERRDAMVQFVQTVMKKDTDYGVVPGTDKPTLLKPGAEKLTTFFGLTTRFQIVEREEDWSGERHGGEPLFYYLYRCCLSRGDHLIAEADGSCNSRESKYRWRWVKESDVPSGVNKDRLHKRASTSWEPEFAVKKKETGGRYGKPAAHWQRFDQAIADGTARHVTKEMKGKRYPGWEIGDTAYRVPNDDVASQVNTIQKMAQKRALVGATLLAVNASEFFTQDVEDMDLIGDGQPVTVPHGVNGATGEVVDGPDLTNTDDFLMAWDFACEGKKLDIPTGRALLEGWMRSVHATTIEDATVGHREALLAKLRGQTPDSIAKIKQRAAQKSAPVGGSAGAAPTGPGDPSTPAPASEQSDAPSSDPDVSGAGAEPEAYEVTDVTIADALAQPWDDSRRTLIAAAHPDMAKGDAAKAIDTHVSLRLGKKGKEDAITPAERRALFDALKENRLELSGNIRERGRK